MWQPALLARGALPGKGEEELQTADVSWLKEVESWAFGSI